MFVALSKSSFAPVVILLKKIYSAALPPYNAQSMSYNCYFEYKLNSSTKN